MDFLGQFQWEPSLQWTGREIFSSCYHWLQWVSDKQGGISCSRGSPAGIITLHLTHSGVLCFHRRQRSAHSSSFALHTEQTPHGRRGALSSAPATEQKRRTARICIDIWLSPTWSLRGLAVPALPEPSVLPALVLLPPLFHRAACEVGTFKSAARAPFRWFSNGVYRSFQKHFLQQIF